MVNTRPNLTELHIAFGCWGGAAPDAAAPRPVRRRSQAQAKARPKPANGNENRTRVHRESASISRTKIIVHHSYQSLCFTTL